jgi:hypothetical protein
MIMRTFPVKIEHLTVYVPVRFASKGMSIGLTPDELIYDIDFNNQFLEEYSESVVDEVNEYAFYCKHEYTNEKKTTKT